MLQEQKQFLSLLRINYLTMNIKYEIKGNKSIKNLYVRMYVGKFDISAPIGLLVLESDWDAKNGNFISANPLNLKLQELTLAILRRYNEAFSQGVVLTSDWLKTIIKDEFNRPVNEVSLINCDKDIYLSSFCEFWIKNNADTWKVSAKKYMSKVQKSQYKKVSEQLAEFEKSVNRKLIMKDLSVEDFYELINYFEEQDYNSSSIDRMIQRLKFFCCRAIEQGLQVNNSFRQRIYIDNESDEVDKPYLTEREINKIINTDFSFDPELNIAKQNYIILLFTGLRGTDGLKNLDISKIDNDLIKIKTSKTGQVVVLPVHNEIKKVIKQNFGNLPPKMNLSDFNKCIKRIAQVCEIDQVIEGKKWDSVKKRRVKGFYKKYSILSSHSCRRGFATLHYGKLPNEVICSALGWKDDSMLKHYVQTTKTEYANQLQDFWAKTN